MSCKYCESDNVYSTIMTKLYRPSSCFSQNFLYYEICLDKDYESLILLRCQSRLVTFRMYVTQIINNYQHIFVKQL